MRRAGGEGSVEARRQPQAVPQNPRSIAGGSRGARRRPLPLSHDRPDVLTLSTSASPELRQKRAKKEQEADVEKDELAH